MQALSDDQRIDILEKNMEKLEKKMDDGFARMERSFAEMREDSRELRGQVAMWGRSILAMWLTIILGFAGIIFAMIAHT
jgi:hypothetical protein